jgi:hypothetical protein
VRVEAQCTNCIFRTKPPFPAYALGVPALMRFLIDHGVDPIAPRGFHLAACEEAIDSTDPLEARYTFGADGDSITLAASEDLSVEAVSRSPDAGPDSPP